MEVLSDKALVAVYGKVNRALPGPEVVFDTDVAGLPRKTRVLFVGNRGHLVLSVPEHSGLETGGGSALVVLVFVGHASTKQERVTVYKILYSICNPCLNFVHTVNGWVLEKSETFLSEENIFHEIEELHHAGTRTP